MTVEELKIILRVNGASTYTHTINEVTNVTNNYKNSIGSLTSMLAKLVSAAAITKFTKECIQAASDLQEVANVTDVTFGQSANVVNKWAKKQAANFGLSETSAKRYIGTYGTMAKQFNFTTEQAAKMGVEMTKLTGDVASFYNMDDKASATKLKSVFTGETETLKELGVVMTEANLNNYALEKGYGKTVKQMSEHEKVLLRYSFVMDKLSHTQGDFQRTSDGWANSVRKLKLNYENLKIEIGNELLPVAGQALSVVSSGLQVIAPIVVNVAHTVRLYGEAWKNASDTTKAFVKISFVALGIVSIAPKVIALTSVAVKFLTMDILTLGGALRALLGIAGIVLAIAAIASLTKDVQELKTAEAASDLGNLGDTAETAEAASDLGNLGDTAETAEAASDLGNLGDTAETAAGAVDDLADSVNDLSDSTKGMELFLASFDEVNKVGDSGSLMSGLINADDLANINGAAAGLGDLNSIMDELNGSISDMSKGMIFSPEWWEEKKKFFGGYWDYLKQSIKDGTLIEDFLTTWGEVDAWFQETIPGWYKFWEGLGEKVYDIVDEAKKTIAGWIDTIKNKFQELSDAFENSAWFKYFSNAGSNLYDVMHENDDNEAETFSYTSPVTGKTYNNVLKYNADGTESELYKKYGSRHAAGGFPNKGSLFLAGEAGAELIGNFGTSQTKVINQSQITNNTQQPVMFQPTILIDGRKITATVVDNINTMTRSSGNSPLIQLG
jgi:hypothetical protein